MSFEHELEFYRPAGKEVRPGIMALLCSLSIMLILCLGHTHVVAQDLKPDQSLLAAAVKGDSVAQFELAEHYFRNETTKNLPEACKWYTKAAQQEHLKAKALLGYFLINGVGGETDFAEGLKWYKRAAQQGSHMAQFNLGLIYEEGRGVNRNIQKVIALFEQASRDTRYSEPQYRIAWLYEHGAGVSQDSFLAKKWYNEAQKQGHPDAANRLALMKAAEMQAAKSREERAAKLTVKRKVAIPEGITNVRIGPTAEYNGRILIGSSYDDVDNEPFFWNLSYAIDIIDGLPEELRKYPDLIKFIQYDPTSKGRERRGISIHVATAYAPFNFNQFPAPVLVNMNADWIGERSFAISLSGAGYLASLHKRLLELSEELAAHRSGEVKMPKKEYDLARTEYNDLVGYFDGSNGLSIGKYECALTEYQDRVEYELQRKTPEVIAKWKDRPNRDCFATKPNLLKLPIIRKSMEAPVSD